MLVTACQTGTPLADSNWPAHRSQIETLNDWILQGRLNIRQQASSDTVSINWQQADDRFTINLSGALGLGATLISGDANAIRLERANEVPIIAGSLRELSRDYLGYEFPAQALYYWVRGIPTPDSQADISLNEAQLLATLNQTDSQGIRWQLEYDRYSNVSGVNLPGRIRMTHPDYRLTLIIQDWQHGSGVQ
tara:strand:+ start:175765 stop:176340 length:576 start_codon:yes stop_codon:yes gene_type:complete